MNVSDLSNSNYIAADDYKVGHIFPAMEIERIDLGDVVTPGTNKKEKKPVVWFRGAKKSYVLTKNVARAIGKAVGETNSIDKNWIGVLVRFIIVGDVRRPDGKRGNAFRIHEVEPRPGSPASPTKDPVINGVNDAESKENGQVPT